MESLFDRIDSKREDLVSLTQDLVRIPTINPPGEDYTRCAEFLGERLAKSGFSLVYERARGTPGDSDRYPRKNVIARFEGKNTGSCVHFNSHLDVVIPGKGWTVDPFGGLVKDGKVFDRGACDMKGGLASSVIAMEAIIEEGINFSVSIEIFWHS